METSHCVKTWWGFAVPSSLIDATRVLRSSAVEAVGPQGKDSLLPPDDTQEVTWKMILQ